MYFKHKMAFILGAGLMLLLPLTLPHEKATETTTGRQESMVSGAREQQSIVPDESFSSAEAPASIEINGASKTRSASMLTSAVSEPVSVRLPTASIIAPLVRTGLNPDGTLRVPPNPQQAGWYTGGPVPGEVGPSVITGHYDSAAGAGVFNSLSNVKVGDKFKIVKNDGSELVFAIEKKDLYLQDEFPTEKVYGSIDYPGVRLITCAGSYNRATKRYSHNLVVFGRLTGTEFVNSYSPLN